MKNGSRFTTISTVFPLLTAYALAASGCGLLIGNVKPVDEKSDHYGVLDLSKDKPSAWTRLDPAEGEPDATRDPETTRTEVSDVAFQAKRSPSIIALNSSCRPSTHKPEQGDEKDQLRELTDQLLLGISGATQRVEKNLTIQTTPALETTLQGKMNGRPISVRTVVLRRNACVYDLLYMAPPTHFEENEKDFSNFVASLRIK
jgi:hypothetical protein